MDYLKIVLDGYCNPTDKKFLKEYFIRESKNAEKEFFYTREVFLTGCKDAVQNYLINDLYRQKSDVRKELLEARQWAKEHDQELFNRTYEQEDNLNIENYTVNLYYLTNGRYTGHMDYSEIMHISNTLDLLISIDDLIDAVKNIQPTGTGTTEPPAGTTLHTKLTPTRLDVLYNYLTDEQLINTTPEMWRFWFTKQSLQAGKKPIKIQWLGAGSVLSNVIMLVCGNFTNHTKTAMEAAFKLKSGTNHQQPKPDRNNRGKHPYKRIYEIMEHAETKLQS